MTTFTFADEVLANIHARIERHGFTTVYVGAG